MLGDVLGVNVLESLVGELAGSHVAAHDVLAGGVFDTELGGSLDDAHSILDDHLDKTGACLVRNTSIVASLEAALALLLQLGRSGLVGLVGRIAFGFAHFGQDVPGGSRLLLLSLQSHRLELTRDAGCLYWLKGRANRLIKNQARRVVLGLACGAVEVVAVRRQLCKVDNL